MYVLFICRVYATILPVTKLDLTLTIRLGHVTCLLKIIYKLNKACFFAVCVGLKTSTHSY